jgi:hypothetical protein
VKKYLPELFLLTVGLFVMALLIYLIALSQGWVSLVCILALGLVWISWYRHLLNLALKSLNVDAEDEDDLPFFPG